jgi:hypothetical protein
MRPALLVIIMDFLVSSLLLFIGNPDEPARGGRSPTAETPAAEEFSVAAISEMENEWMQEYQDQLRDMKLATQQEQLAALAAEKSTLATRVTRQSAEIQRQQIAADNLAREIKMLTDQRASKEAALRQAQSEAETLAREKADLTEAKARLEKMAAALAEAKVQGERLLKEAEARQKDLQSQNVQMRTSVAAQAEAIRRQNETIAGQQKIIDQSLRNVALAQSRMETKTDVLQRGQNQMQATLTDLQSFASRLPADLQANAQRIASEQRRLETVVTGLVALVSGSQSGLSPAEQKAVSDRLALLTSLHQQLNQNIQGLLATGVVDRVADNLVAVREQQRALQNEMSGLVHKMEDYEARQSGPFGRFRNARLLVRVAMAAEGTSNHTMHSLDNDRYDSTAYVPLLAATDRILIVTHMRDLGLQWNGISWYLTELNFSLATSGTTQLTATIKGPIQILAGDRHLALIDCAQDAGLSDLIRQSKMSPMKIIGRQALEKRGLRDVYLLKSSTGGIGFMAETTQDLDAPGYLLIRRTFRPLLDKVARYLFVNPESRPEPGDFLVTAEGEVIGVMVDDRKCFILTEEAVAKSARRIPLNVLPTFAREVIQLRQELEEE